MSRRDQDRWDKPKRQRTQRFAPAEPMQGREEPRRRRRHKSRPLVEVTEARDRRPGGEFGRAAQLGDNSEIATKKGYRAAVIPLRKGLFLVAELPVEATKSEFGVVPLLGPLMVKAAVKALTGSGEERRLTSGSGTYYVGLRWSPDSSKILTYDAAMMLRWVDAGSGEQHEISGSPTERSFDAAWSPDSRWVAFAEAEENEFS